MLIFNTQLVRKRFVPVMQATWIMKKNISVKP